MKKLISALLIIFLTSTSSFAILTSYEKKKVELKCPAHFLDNPPKFFYCVYSDYHNHKFDNGIKKAELALKEIEPLYKKDPNAKVPNWETKDGKLKDPQIYKVKSELHMLLGMLYFKKSLNVDTNSDKKIYRNFYSKLEKKGFNFFEINRLMDLYVMKKLFPESFKREQNKEYEKLLKRMDVKEEDLDELFAKAQEAIDRADRERLKYLSLAIKNFQKAVKVDPENALAYYQLGNLYSGLSAEAVPGDSEAAEKAYYKAALILKKEGDKEGYKEVLKRIELLNPRSKYLRLLESNDA